MKSSRKTINVPRDLAFFLVLFWTSWLSLCVLLAAGATGRHWATDLIATLATTGFLFSGIAAEKSR